MRHPAARELRDEFSLQPGAPQTQLQEHLMATREALEIAFLRWEHWTARAQYGWAYLARTYDDAAARLDHLKDPAERRRFTYNGWRDLAAAEWENMNTTWLEQQEGGKKGSRKAGPKHEQPSKEGPRLRRRLRQDTRDMLCDGFRGNRAGAMLMKTGFGTVRPLARLYGDMANLSPGPNPGAGGAGRGQGGKGGLFGDLRHTLSQVHGTALLAAEVMRNGGWWSWPWSRSYRPPPLSLAELASITHNAETMIDALDRALGAAERVREAMDTVCMGLARWEATGGVSVSQAGIAPWLGVSYEDMYGNPVAPGGGADAEGQKGDKPRAGGLWEGWREGGWKGLWEALWQRLWKGIGIGNKKAKEKEVEYLLVGMPPVRWAARLFSLAAEAMQTYTTESKLRHENEYIYRRRRRGKDLESYLFFASKRKQEAWQNKYDASRQWVEE
ncbi:hypothetical protein F5X98DRAFT_359656 [Xylaria grammica]|nr:hypothetical protein F5X98DRAFT_359656 [Xylaria grammica]